MLTVLLGGARSGKSALAVTLGRRHEGAGGRVVFVATSPQIDGDTDWAARVARHRAERPAWPTVEAPADLTGALASIADDAMAIVDCLTLWVSNLMYHHDTADSIVAAADELVGAIAARRGPTVVVSNEVGLGIHPETELGRDVPRHTRHREPHRHHRGRHRAAPRRGPCRAPRPGGATAVNVIAFPGHAGRDWTLTRWRSFARTGDRVQR